LYVVSLCAFATLHLMSSASTSCSIYENINLIHGFIISDYSENKKFHSFQKLVS
jgi:hypothetical protein